MAKMAVAKRSRKRSEPQTAVAAHGNFCWNELRTSATISPIFNPTCCKCLAASRLQMRFPEPINFLPWSEVRLTTRATIKTFSCSPGITLESILPSALAMLN